MTRYKVTVTFDLPLYNGEKLQSGTRPLLKEKLKNLIQDLNIMSYKDSILHGSYDSDIIPVNIKTKVTKVIK
jgi:hypothetical protein